MKVLRNFCLLFLVMLFAPTAQMFCQIIVVDHKIKVTVGNSYCFVNRGVGQKKINVYKTIQSAIDAANEGDTIIVREGMYKEAIIINKKMITLKNFGHEEVVIDGNNPRLGPLVKIEASDIKIMGLKVMHSSTFGIYSADNDNIMVRDCEVAYSEDGGIVFVSGENVLIEHSVVHHNNYKGLQAAHEGITLRGVRHFEVRFCEVFDNKEEGIDAKYGALYGKIHHNHVYRNNGPNIYIDHGNQIEIYNNIVHSAVSKSGISLNIESNWRPKDIGWTVHDIKVYNNLIYNNSGGIGFWLEPGKGSEENAHWDNIYIMNNTLVNNSRPNASRGGGIYVANGELHNFGNNVVIKNNIIWDKTNGVSKCIWDYSGKIINKFKISHNALPIGEPTDAKGDNPVLVTEIHFIDPYNHNYRLSNISPAISKGEKAGAPLYDLDGHVRCQESGSDIGAYGWVQPFFDFVPK